MVTYLDSLTGCSHCWTLSEVIERQQREESNVCVYEPLRASSSIHTANAVVVELVTLYMKSFIV